MRRPAILACAAVGELAAFLPMAGFALFLSGLSPWISIDGPEHHAADGALGVDLALLLSFAVVHSVMARPGFKTRWTRVVPQPLERSLYSTVAGAQITLLLALWRPLPEPVWSVPYPVGAALLWAGQSLGWLIVLAALHEVGSGRLFGWHLAKAWAGRVENVPPPIATGGPYRWVRHPVYSGTILAMFSAPVMSRGHLLLAVVLTLYLLVGIRFEESDLARQLGTDLTGYRRRVPALVPALFGRRSRAAGA